MKNLSRILIVLFAASVGVFTSFAGPEPVASDYKETKNVAPVPPPCDWSGFYIGINVGGTFGNTSHTDIDGYNEEGGAERWSYDASGVVAGGEIGYNRQWNRLVLGIEADGGYFGLEGSKSQPGSPDGDTIGHTDEGFYATFRGRFGVTFMQNKLLPYITGGGILINNEVGVFDHRDVLPAGAGLGDGSSDDVRFGWTLGGGLAYAVNCHWSVKLEYLYYDLETEDFNFVGQGVKGPGFVDRFNADTDGHIVRVGLDYRF